MRLDIWHEYGFTDVGPNNTVAPQHRKSNWRVYLEKLKALSQERGIR